jgi:hypothetical protein
MLSERQCRIMFKLRYVGNAGQKVKNVRFLTVVDFRLQNKPSPAIKKLMMI